MEYTENSKKSRSKKNNKTMKKQFLSVVVLCVGLFMCACSNQKTQAQTTEETVEATSAAINENVETSSSMGAIDDDLEDAIEEYDEALQQATKDYDAAMKAASSSMKAANAVSLQDVEDALDAYEDALNALDNDDAW